MLLHRLELVDFRSYAGEDLRFAPGVTLLLGPNASGKTNILEAAYRVATGGSHRVASDEPLVRQGRDAAYVRMGLRTDAGRDRRIEMELHPGAGTRVKVDGQDVRRSSDALGVLRVVLFAPEDLTVVRETPSQRRRFLDDVLTQRRPAYGATRREYDRVLRQRNQLLKDARGLRRRDGGTPSDAGRTLDVWTEQLVRHGAALTAARVAGTHALTGPTNRFYGRLADRQEPVGLEYRSSSGLTVTGAADAGPPQLDEIDKWLREALEEVRDDEVDRGVTLVGPHRDDLHLAIGKLPARGYASHGQLWSLALSLRLATYEVLAEVGDRPVVLLDDVFAELDERRRRRLAEACRRWDQVVVTAAVEDDVPLDGEVVDIRLADDASHAVPRGHRESR